MHFRVRRIVELLRHEVVTVLLQQFFGLVNRAAHSLSVGGQDQARAVGAEQAAAFFAHRIGHR